MAIIVLVVTFSFDIALVVHCLVFSVVLLQIVYGNIMHSDIAILVHSITMNMAKVVFSVTFSMDFGHSHSVFFVFLVLKTPD